MGGPLDGGMRGGKLGAENIIVKQEILLAEGQQDLLMSIFISPSNFFSSFSLQQENNI